MLGAKDQRGTRPPRDVAPNTPPHEPAFRDPGPHRDELSPRAASLDVPETDMGKLRGSARICKLFHRHRFTDTQKEGALRFVMVFALPAIATCMKHFPNRAEHKTLSIENRPRSSDTAHPGQALDRRCQAGRDKELGIAS